MPLFETEDKKILFVHIPKTGGTAVENQLSKKASRILYSLGAPDGLRVSPQHLTINDLKALLGVNGWDWAFSVVRNPYEKLESEYFFRTENTFKRFGDRPDFSSWILNGIRAVRKDRHHMDNHWRPQTDFIDADVSLFRLEEGLELPVFQAQRHLHDESGLSQIEKANTGQRADVDWSLEALNAVHAFYEADFTQLGYEMRTRKLSFFNRT